MTATNNDASYEHLDVRLERARDTEVRTAVWRWSQP